ncbi:hypothetical protein IscW_ISCW012231 [Ixodes scapularis]|uniref:Laminin EGF-like domain-containing protein n=1 Tax=Ixodes scapularis TaxID=6945 RepID=B7QBV9_IXOSC|nr:hypothetical protein IscW_ISCW012231 [Ixodes scapularis]|eukprot:XP_002413023.1 hypothetical protein IscW_ISCW012231 [Ixodes scapularis]
MGDVGKEDGLGGGPPTVSCRSCLPGHRGPLCSACTAGYHWKGDRCEPINCLSFALCARDRDSPGCRDCDLVQNSLPPVAQKSSGKNLAHGLVVYGFSLAVNSPSSGLMGSSTASSRNYTD